MHRLVGLRARHSLLITGVLVALVAFPIGVIASHQFGDVPNTNDYHNDIDAIADAGVTSGCGDGNYCPAAHVTREQMAAFMNRLGALQAGKTPVVNAKTSQSTDGWSMGCPSNTVLAGGLCFDTSTRGSGSVYDASEACANLGSSLLIGHGQIWKLPAALELRAADQNGDITIVEGADEWTSTIYYNGSYRAIAYDGAAVVDTATTTSLPYRCAALPVSRDLLSIIIGPDKDGSATEPSKANAGPKNADGSTK